MSGVTVKMKMTPTQAGALYVDHMRLEKRVLKLEKALKSIEKWHGEFPATGKYWEKENIKMMSYGAAFGSNGERDFMRTKAREALIEESSN